MYKYDLRYDRYWSHWIFNDETSLFIGSEDGPVEVVKVQNLYFAYSKDISVFSGINFTAHPGEVVLLKGTSGRGKSTLASLIAGHLKPQSGSVEVDRKKIFSPSRDVIVVHQENDLFPWLSVKGHLLFLKEAGLETETIDLDGYLQKFGLAKSKDLFPKEISGGMKRRLAILRGMLLKPKVLILDESLSSLDDKWKNDILSEVKSFTEKNNILLILIDHNTESIGHLISRVVEL
ncbi:hypothetical protein DOM21_00990 [Bacteriovorax stolpii]|nr:hypothetical protein DOM21_00990 [Bacteriovorax stolpii]